MHDAITHGYAFFFTVAFNKIQHVYHVAIGRVIFRAWYAVMKDAKETREYFEVMIVEC